MMSEKDFLEYIVKFSHRERKNMIAAENSRLIEYLWVDENRKLVKIHTNYDNDVWFESEFIDGDRLKLESFECELKVDEIYLKVNFQRETIF